MSTLHQLVSSHKRYTKRRRPLVPALKKCPQKRGVVQKIFIQTPKKPNSAKRKVAKVKLSTGRVISCYIPGIGHKLTKHSVVLVRGGRAQDLIGVRYKPIHGKHDFRPPEDRITRLSKYGLSNKDRSKPSTPVEPQAPSILPDIRSIVNEIAVLRDPLNRVSTKRENAMYSFDRIHIYTYSALYLRGRS